MIDWIQLTQDLISSPWLYVVLFTVSALDSFLPLIPSEPVIIIAGVFAVSGETNLLLVIAATAAGAWAGDQFPYWLGRLFGKRMLTWLPEGSKRRASYTWVEKELARRGGFVLVTGRFIPVGRYLITLTTGMVNYPFRKYAFFTAFGAVSWSAYTVLTGYLGGVAFQDNPWAAIAVGIGLALAMIAVLEAVRHLRQRRAMRAHPETNTQDVDVDDHNLQQPNPPALVAG